MLIDKQYRDYTYFSRYTNVPYYYNTDDKRLVNGTTSQLVQDISYALYKVKIGDSWDSIALENYNNPTYYWILCDFNQVQDPFIDPEPDTYVKIPVLSDLKFEG